MGNGKESGEAGRHQEAVRFFSEAIGVKPRHGGAYVSRGWAFFQLRAYQEAFEDASEGVRLDPTISRGFFIQALVLGLEGNLDGCLKQVEKALRMDSQAPGLWCLRGSVQLVLAQESTGAERKALGTKAAADLTQALRLCPDHAEATYNRGLCHAEFGNHHAAIEDFTTAMMLDPDIENMTKIVKRDEKSRLARAAAKANVAAKATAVQPFLFRLPGDS